MQHLADSVFHAKLGTMAQKVERITVLAGELADYIPDCGAGDVTRCPSRQGRFGQRNGLRVSPNCRARWAATTRSTTARIPPSPTPSPNTIPPVGPGDNCPTAPLSVAVALADKLDTLVGFFAIDEKPTGSRDPYALRRAALGIIRLILENQPAPAAARGLHEGLLGL